MIFAAAIPVYNSPVYICWFFAVLPRKAALRLYKVQKIASSHHAKYQFSVPKKIPLWSMFLTILTVDKTDFNVVKK